MTKYTEKEQAQLDIANEIIRQMGGSGILKSFVGASDIYATESGVQFRFKGSKKMNKVVISLTPLDLYDLKFYKTAKYSSGVRIIDGKIVEVKSTFEARLKKSMIPVDEIDGVYYDLLVDVFESKTGLYLHF